MTERATKEDLLKPGQSIVEWWIENGTDHNAVRAQRILIYARQKQEAKYVMENSTCAIGKPDIN